MMGGRSWDDWIEEYAESHQHPINKLMHSFGIPMIALSLLLVPVSFFIGGMWRIALGLFVVGWVIQFVGHKYEGMKPVFTDDIMGLVIGPLFIMTEVFFMLGLKTTLKKYVEDRVGPTLAARDGAPIGPQQHHA